MFNLKKKKEDLPENFQELAQKVKDLEEESRSLKKEIKEIEEKQQFFLQNVGMIRFNPFYQEGGNQSFSLALLDGEGTGVVVTSLYTKEGNRVYSKSVKKGLSEYSLSVEEEKVIKESIKKKE